MDPNTLAFHFRVGAFVFQRNLHGLTHNESMQPPKPAGNTLNWVVGHVVRTRNQALMILGKPPLFPESDFDAYNAAKPNAGRILSLDDLQDRYTQLGEKLADTLQNCSAAALEAPAPFSPTGNPDETVGTLLASIAFHEAYHLGQTGFLRRLLGKPGALAAPGEQGH